MYLFFLILFRISNKGLILYFFSYYFRFQTEQCFYKLEMYIERKRKKRKKKCILFVGCILLGNNREGWGLAKCDAPKPGGPLTTRQPAEYKWRSGYPKPL